MARPARPTGAASTIEADANVFDLGPKALLNALRKQSFAFWALNFYLFIEYVRPQDIWTGLDVLPWGQLAIGVAVVAAFAEPSVRQGLRTLDGLLIGFSVILVASIVLAYDASSGMDKFTVYLNWVLLYYMVTRVVNSEVRLFLFFAAFSLWSLKMSQFGARAFIANGGSFSGWGTSGAPGWFHNSGEFAIQMCIFLPMTLHVILGLRHRWPRWKTVMMLLLLPGTALIGVIASSSRGGQIAAAAVLLFMVGQSRYRVRGFTWIIVLLPALWFIVPEEQKLRFSMMGDANDDTSQTRLTYWRRGIEIMNDRPILGVGFNNWMPYYRDHYGPGQLPHNIFIEAGSEMGYLGLGAFVLLIGASFAVNARTRRMARALPTWQPFYRSFTLGLDAALIGYLVSGFFVTVLFYPFFWMNLSFVSAAYLLVERRYATVTKTMAADRARAHATREALAPG